MKKINLKRVICAAACVLIAASCAGCTAHKPVSASVGVDVREKLAALTASDEELGIAGKYAALSDIRDGSVDPDLVGTWISADGDVTYTFTDDGIEKASSSFFEDSEVPFTCLTVGDIAVICEELTLSPDSDDGAKKSDTQLSYKTYCVENDALYQLNVEEVNETEDTFQSTLVLMYRADAAGSATASVEKNPISLQSLAGTWTSEKGDVTIKNGKLTCGKDHFTLSFDEKQNLVVEKGGIATAYKMALCVRKEYGGEEEAKKTESTLMNLTFTGANGLDKPNLRSVLDDWKTAYNWDSWYYTGSFALQA